MWNRLYSNNTPQINPSDLPKKALNKAFTECENAMLESTTALGFFGTTTVGSEQKFESELINKIKDDHHQRLIDKNMQVQLLAVLEGKHKVDDLITQARNLHYVRHPRYSNLFVLIRKDQFESIISILHLRKKMEELKQEVDHTINMSQTDFENFISRSKEIADQFKKIVEPLSSIFEPNKMFSDSPLLFPFGICMKHVGQCDSALSNASRQVTTLFPQPSKCTIS